MPACLTCPVSDHEVMQYTSAATTCARQEHSMQSCLFLHLKAPLVVPQGVFAARFACQLSFKWCCMVPPSVFVSVDVPRMLLCCSPQPLRRGKKKMCVSSVMDRAPKALAAGDELCISYNYGQRHPDPEAAQEQCYQAFLTRGFVPDEYLSARRSEKDRILAPAWLDKLALLINDADTTSQEPVCPR